MATKVYQINPTLWTRILKKSRIPSFGEVLAEDIEGNYENTSPSLNVTYNSSFGLFYLTCKTDTDNEMIDLGIEDKKIAREYGFVVKDIIRANLEMQ